VPSRYRYTKKDARRAWSGGCHPLHHVSRPYDRTNNDDQRPLAYPRLAAANKATWRTCTCTCTLCGPYQVLSSVPGGIHVSMSVCMGGSGTDRVAAGQLAGLDARIPRLGAGGARRRVRPYKRCRQHKVYLWPTRLYVSPAPASVGCAPFPHRCRRCLAPHKRRRRAASTRSA
jgi:hypothetical protein